MPVGRRTAVTCLPPFAVTPVPVTPPKAVSGPTLSRTAIPPTPHTCATVYAHFRTHVHIPTLTVVFFRGSPWPAVPAFPDSSNFVQLSPAF
jgi:hypothetical protein